MSRIKDEILRHSEDAEGKYFAVTRSGETRLDLRLNNGDRLSLPYSYMQGIQLTCQAESGDELLSLTIPNAYYIEVLGEGLAILYEALNRLSLRFLREADGEAEEGVTVKKIKVYRLSDPVAQLKGAE